MVLSVWIQIFELQKFENTTVLSIEKYSFIVLPTWAINNLEKERISGSVLLKKVELANMNIENVSRHLGSCFPVDIFKISES